MGKTGKFFCIISFLSIMIPIAALASPIDPSTLVKVTPGNDPRCVEYYIYKDEIYCSTTAQSSQPVDPNIKQYEKLNIVFDDRPWKMAWGNKDETGMTVEYVPNGEDVEHWNELVTSQFFPGLQDKATLKEFAENFIQDLKDAGYDPLISFLQESEDQVIFEFRIEHPENQIQDELEMITKDNKGIYLLHYVIKKADMGQENRDKWFQNLKDSTIKE